LHFYTASNTPCCPAARPTLLPHTVSCRRCACPRPLSTWAGSGIPATLAEEVSTGARRGGGRRGTAAAWLFCQPGAGQPAAGQGQQAAGGCNCVGLQPAASQGWATSACCTSLFLMHDSTHAHTPWGHLCHLGDTRHQGTPTSCFVSATTCPHHIPGPLPNPLLPLHPTLATCVCLPPCPLTLPPSPTTHHHPHHHPQ
jgi:hypothetical protein